MAVGATDRLHELLGKTFGELGASGPMVRTILLSDRQFAGQKWRCGGVQAVSLAGEDEIAFYDEGGALAKTVKLAAEEQNRAA